MSVKYFECDNGLRLNVDKYFITGAIAVSVVSPTVLSKKKTTVLAKNRDIYTTLKSERLQLEIYISN